MVVTVSRIKCRRRHLMPPIQRSTAEVYLEQATIVASAQDWSRAQVVGSNQFVSRGPLTSADLIPGDTVDDRRALSGAAGSTQRQADMVARKDPEPGSLSQKRVGMRVDAKTQSVETL